MNNIEKAAEKLRNGWCKHDIYNADDGSDKFCAVGALGSVILGQQVMYPYSLGDDEAEEEYHQWETRCYKVAETSEEGRIIANVIAEQYPEYARGGRIGLDHVWRDGQYQEVIYLFNDRSDSVDRVLTVFDKAAVIYDELHG